MAGDFARRVRDLADEIGEGRLTGRIVVNQVYAAVQHNDASLRHPRGGQAFYLSDPLMNKHRGYYRQLANAVLGGDLVQAMADAVEDLSDQVYMNAPVEFYDLKRSGHPTVEDNGAVVYDRPAEVPRLTPAQLAQKSRARAMGQVPGN